MINLNKEIQTYNRTLEVNNNVDNLERKTSYQHTTDRSIDDPLIPRRTHVQIIIGVGYRNKSIKRSLRT